LKKNREMNVIKLDEALVLLRNLLNSYSLLKKQAFGMI